MWDDESQRSRVGLDLRGADLRGADLFALTYALLSLSIHPGLSPLGCLIFSIISFHWCDFFLYAVYSLLAVRDGMLWYT